MILGPRHPSHPLELQGGHHSADFYVEGLAFPDASFPGLVSLNVSLLHIIIVICNNLSPQRAACEPSAPETPGHSFKMHVLGQPLNRWVSTLGTGRGPAVFSQVTGGGSCSLRAPANHAGSQGDLPLSSSHCFGAEGVRM